MYTSDGRLCGNPEAEAVTRINGETVTAVREDVFEVTLKDGYKFLFEVGDIEGEYSRTPPYMIEGLILKTHSLFE